MTNKLGKKKALLLSGIFTVLYGVQFLLLPRCLPRYYPVSLEAGWLFILSLLAFSIIGTALGTGKLRTWLIPDALYGVLLWLYNGRGLYGIGLRGVNLDGMRPIYSKALADITILILLLLLVTFQSLLCGLVWIVKKLKK